MRKKFEGWLILKHLSSLSGRPSGNFDFRVDVDIAVTSPRFHDDNVPVLALVLHILGYAVHLASVKKL